MANRNDSDVHQHETLPGPGPGPGRNATLTGAAGVRPVEQMVDAAIERVAREQEAHDREAREGEGRALDLAEREHAASHQPQHALVLPNAAGALARKPTRLRWKGLDVSDEFRNYAERVARGEDLPPFEGPVLAQPNPAFPFGPAPVEQESTQELPASPAGRASRVALWTSAALVLALLGWSLARTVDTEASAGLNGMPSASQAPVTATPAGADPRDGVDAPASTEAQAVEGNQDPGVTDIASSLSEPQRAVEALMPAVAAPPSAEVTASSSEPVVAVVPTPAPAASSAPPASVAPPLASAQSVAPLPQAASTASTAAAPATMVPEDDFGILTAGDEAPVASPANPPLPGAKSVPSVNGSVGDVARSAQAPGATRKEPGSESSAKGSLLVETPSF